MCIGYFAVVVVVNHRVACLFDFVWFQWHTIGLYSLYFIHEHTIQFNSSLSHIVYKNIDEFLFNTQPHGITYALRSSLFLPPSLYMPISVCVGILLIIYLFMNGFDIGSLL